VSRFLEFRKSLKKLPIFLMNLYLITTNGPAPEDGSVYYCTGVLAQDENEAAFKYLSEYDGDILDFIIHCDLDPSDPDYDKDAFESHYEIVLTELLI
jgi:hypothetical protein